MVVVVDLVQHFAILRIIIAWNPRKVPSLPYLYETLDHAQAHIGQDLSPEKTKSRASVVKIADPIYLKSLEKVNLFTDRRR